MADVGPIYGPWYFDEDETLYDQSKETKMGTNPKGEAAALEAMQRAAARRTNTPTTDATDDRKPADAIEASSAARESAIEGLRDVWAKNTGKTTSRDVAVARLADMARSRSTRPSTRTPLNDLIPTSRRGR